MTPRYADDQLPGLTAVGRREIVRGILYGVLLVLSAGALVVGVFTLNFIIVVFSVLLIIRSITMIRRGK